MTVGYLSLELVTFMYERETNFFYRPTYMTLEHLGREANPTYFAVSIRP